MGRRGVAFFINTARGPIVDQAALLAVLQAGRIAGAGLDVFAEEPLPAGHLLTRLDNVILAPHSLAWMDQLYEDNGISACEGVLAVLRGGLPRYPVNRQVVERAGFQAKLQELATRWKLRNLARSGGQLDICHVTRYIILVIKTFADKETQLLYVSGRSRRLPPDTVNRALRRLEYVDLADTLNDLRTPPSNRLHALQGDREGQHSISINDQWRICFRFIDGDAYDVEIIDYH